MEGEGKPVMGHFERFVSGHAFQACRGRAIHKSGFSRWGCTARPAAKVVGVQRHGRHR
ncbi:hypothetical protein SBA1_770008 [Candidatus Sulfotelmatobacter kueseliae]|uniref:Uncharacterized protein n=1 Tax=Candidatus Sulfotelmatobacter kueseliae TaxID=2042962 RepID=A0A2U3L759_9BACT|nr:hypothetical protein SBA1_770008 [Candidatus Sulfotelmatobacter kueseliae]